MFLPSYAQSQFYEESKNIDCIVLKVTVYIRNVI